MAKKIKNNETFNICDDCKHCEWHTMPWNLDPLGKPITFGCRENVFEHGEVRGRRACELFKSK